MNRFIIGTIKMHNKAILSIFLILFLFVGTTRAQELSGVVNSYARVTAISGSTFVIDNISGTESEFSAGKKVLIIQMKGAEIDRTNTANYGSIADLKEAGNYEFAIIKMRSGSGPEYSITLHNVIRTYDATSFVQIVSVPEHGDATITGDVLALPWDRTNGIGGVVALEVSGTLTLAANIDASGKGFAGGVPNPSPYGGGTDLTTFATTANNVSAQKGEGIAAYGPEGEYGMGSLANGGGGGNSHNAGGGGGGNISSGGAGGDSYNGTGGGGMPGKSLDLDPLVNKLFMGGGGGGGQQNNYTSSVGGAGGGIIIIRADTIASDCNGFTRAILANGASALNTTGNDGAGGGGAGGSIVLDINHFNLSCNIEIYTHGGNGGSVTVSQKHAGGGGGGAGAILLPGTAGNAFTTIRSNSGTAGLDCSGATCTSTGTSGDICSGDACEGDETWPELPNSAPIATDDTASTMEDHAVEIQVTDNDTDPDHGNIFTVSTISGPENGILTLEENRYTYTPSIDFVGIDSFEYQICDGGIPLLCNTAMVVVTINSVNDVPVAVHDTVVVNENEDALIHIIANDYDIEGDELNVSAAAVAFPENGTLVFNPDNTVTYQPDPNFVGSDQFKYEVCDNGSPIGCATAIVTITVDNVNYSPAAVDDLISTREDESVNINVVANDSDPDGDILAVSPTPIVKPQFGELQLSGSTYTYVPNDNYYGSDSFVYEICDNGSPTICATATVAISISPVNDPPVAVEDHYSNKDLIATITGNVLENDFDLDHDHLSVDLHKLILPLNGQLIMEEDGEFSYQPKAGFYGEDVFEYDACDNGDPSLCAKAKVFLSVSSGISKGFSPNGDGENEEWKITGIENYPMNTVIILNRWGDTVFEIKGYDNVSRVWRGEANRGIQMGANTLPDGTYFYIIDFGNGRAKEKGFIIIKR